MYLTTSLTEHDIRKAAREVGRLTFGDRDAITVELEHVADITRGANAGRTRYRVKLGAESSTSRAARRSWSGKPGPWLCWHGFRDVFALWLTLDRRAVIRTGLETYRGAAGFLDTFPAAAARAVGGTVTLADLCSCEGPTDGGRFVSRLRKTMIRPGDLALHVGGHLNSRRVASVDFVAGTVTLRIGTTETGPLPMANYTYHPAAI